MDFYTGSLRPNMGPELVLRTGPSLAFQISLNLQSLQAVNLYPRVISTMYSGYTWD
jgi:hypothetical protein